MRTEKKSLKTGQYERSVVKKTPRKNIGLDKLNFFIWFYHIVLDKIGDIAVLTNGMDLKTQLNTWKAFAKLATTHDVILKRLDSTSCITSRYVDMAKDIQAFLSDCLEVIQFATLAF